MKKKSLKHITITKSLSLDEQRCIFFTNLKRGSEKRKKVFFTVEVFQKSEKGWEFCKMCEEYTPVDQGFFFNLI